MEGLLSLLIYAVLFYFLMRYGCGAHVVHGHHQHKAEDNLTDPVCGKPVAIEQGYGVMYEGTLYRFCSKHCLDQFDEQPKIFIHHLKQEHHHES